MRSARQDLQSRKARKKLGELTGMLARVDDSAFLQLAWAVNILQSDFGIKVNPYLHYPTKAATADMSSELAVHKWDIETLVTLLLSTSKYRYRAGEMRQTMATNRFNTMAVLVNTLRDTENHQAGAQVGNGNILQEMSRIGYRQFEWQRGFATTERLYRYLYVYGQGACADYFGAQFGLPLVDFIKVGFYLFTQLHHAPWSVPVPIEKIGIDVALIERALPLFSRDLADVRTETNKLIAGLGGRAAGRVSYLPSALRRFPIIRDPKTAQYMAPLPQLIMFRMTGGLYYDIAGGPQKLMTEANERFETYVRNLVMAYLPRFQALPSQSYGTKKFPLSSPDVLLLDGDQITVVMECKATKLTYDAQFADDPMEAARNAYAQITKGIAQLWRFFSQVRRGVYVGPPVAAQAHAVLLCMDAWMQMSHDKQKGVIAAARELVQQEPDVTDEDKRPVVFCSMQDLADVLITSNEDQFLSSLGSAVLPEYQGWDFREVRRHSAGPEDEKAFPFDVAELAPWWNYFAKPKAA